MKKITISGRMIELEKKRIKNMYLRILPPDGRIHISAPLKMSDYEIEKFVNAKLDWIDEQQEKVRQRSISKELNFVSGENIPVWGKSFLLIVENDQKNNSVTVSNGRLYLSLKQDSTNLQRQKLLYQWYRKELMQKIPELIDRWEPVMGVKSSSFTIRDMKTRWGTCNIRTKKICLNLQLAKKPEKCLEYVVVHELVHLLEKSHNAVFKAYMDRFLPEWRSIKKELNYSNI